ncbi:MAG: Sec-independent protein translocase protein TatB [Pseudomonadota bacterium]
MLDLGWTELVLIGAVALIVVGPKDLPRMLRTVGQYVGKARSMARQFQRSMEDAARDADVADAAELRSLREAKSDFDRMARMDFSDRASRAQSSSPIGANKTPAAGTTKAPAAAAGKEATAGDKATAAPASDDPAPAAPAADQAAPKA